MVAGVSGGPDSLCLLDSLSQLGVPLVAAYFDHQLRPDSARDGETVRAAADKRSIPFALGSGDVAGYAREAHLSIEEAARTLRYHFLFDLAREWQAQAVAVGHTADDQVETLLMHLLRGSGLSGLRGMPFRAIIPAWDLAVPLVRPLLAFWREETLAYCRAQGLEPVYDPTNQDTAFFRNRLRHELIPFLETYNPRIRSVLWRTAEVLRGDAEVVQEAVEGAWESCFIAQREGSVLLRLAEVRALSSGLRRGVLRYAAACLDPMLRDLDFAAVQRAEDHVLSGLTGSSIDLVQGMRLVLEADRLVLSRPGVQAIDPDWPQVASPEPVTLAVPGYLALTSGWRIQSEWANPQDFRQPGERWEAWLDADALLAEQAGSPPSGLPLSLTVRPPRAGDRFQPLGMDGHSVRLSDFWIDNKLPRRARSGWPLVLASEVIVWVPGFRPAHPFRITEHTRRAIRLRAGRG